jgi:voltage-dependent anion channel protein 2
MVQDLGKSSNDLLSKDLPVFGTSLEVKTKTPTGVVFKVAGTRDTKSTAITGDVEAKYLDPKNGLAITQAWTTTNVLRYVSDRVISGYYLLISFRI